VDQPIFGQCSDADQFDTIAAVGRCRRQLASTTDGLIQNIAKYIMLKPVVTLRYSPNRLFENHSTAAPAARFPAIRSELRSGSGKSAPPDRQPAL
jgi:hypothetical protein